MTQTQAPIAPATTAISAPLNAAQLRWAAYNRADITNLDGVLVYPGMKLLWFGENTCDGDWEYAADLMNGKALLTGTPTLSSVAQVKLVMRLIEQAVLAGDYAQATKLERALWEGALEGVASGTAQAGYVAAEALKSKVIVFPRQAL